MILPIGCIYQQNQMKIIQMPKRSTKKPEPIKRNLSPNAPKRRGRPPKPKDDESLKVAKEDRIGDFIVPIIEQDKEILQTRTRKNKRSPERVKQINQRIEECRGLMCLMMSRGDICRTLSRAWGISSKSVDRYYDEARKRQLQILDTTQEDLKGNSLSFWVNKLRIAESQRAKAQKDIDAGQEFARQAKLSMDKMDLNVDTLRQLDNILKRAQRMIQNGHQNVANAEATARSIQDRIDKLSGNITASPIRIVDKDGNDVDLKPEPMTQVDVRQNIINVIQSIKGTASKEDMEILEPLMNGDIPKIEIPICECDEEER
jgi:hypothetical protein